MGGLVVATALTVLFLPALYAAWFRVKPVVPAPAPAPARRAEEPRARAPEAAPQMLEGTL
jgi:multidrug efflux pump